MLQFTVYDISEYSKWNKNEQTENESSDEEIVATSQKSSNTDDESDEEIVDPPSSLSLMLTNVCVLFVNTLKHMVMTKI